MMAADDDKSKRKPFCIVQFTTDGDSVEVCPSTWLSSVGAETQCSWPPDKMRFVQASSAITANTNQYVIVIMVIYTA